MSGVSSLDYLTVQTEDKTQRQDGTLARVDVGTTKKRKQKNKNKNEFNFKKLGRGDIQKNKKTGNHKHSNKIK